MNIIRAHTQVEFPPRIHRQQASQSLKIPPINQWSYLLNYDLPFFDPNSMARDKYEAMSTEEQATYNRRFHQAVNSTITAEAKLDVDNKFKLTATRMQEYGQEFITWQLDLNDYEGWQNRAIVRPIKYTKELNAPNTTFRMATNVTVGEDARKELDHIFSQLVLPLLKGNPNI